MKSTCTSCRNGGKTFTFVTKSICKYRIRSLRTSDGVVTGLTKLPSKKKKRKKKKQIFQMIYMKMYFIYLFFILWNLDSFFFSLPVPIFKFPKGISSYKLPSTPFLLHFHFCEQMKLHDYGVTQRSFKSSIF